MPKTSFSRGQAVTVWGEARPAKYGDRRADGRDPVPGPRQGCVEDAADRQVQARYFSVKQKFPGSGNVRLAYTYPKSDPLLPVGLAGKKIIGRSQAITVR